MYFYSSQGRRKGWKTVIASVAEALRYKPESRGFDSRWVCL